MRKTKQSGGYCAVVDNEMLNRKRYIMLIKRSNKPLGDTVNKIVDLTMHVKGKDIGVEICCSSYLHGRYDWMFCFTAEDIRHAKKFSELLTKEYGQIISEIHLLEDIFSVKNCNVVNPNIEKLREFL